jgi:hypothetical protein
VIADRVLVVGWCSFAFCKPDEVLDEAAKRFLKLKPFAKSQQAK